MEIERSLNALPRDMCLRRLFHLRSRPKQLLLIPFRYETDDWVTSTIHMTQEKSAKSVPYTTTEHSRTLQGVCQ